MTEASKFAPTDYTYHSTYAEVDGEYRNGPELRECLTCGALVGDTDRHDEWHRPWTRP